MFKRSSVKTPNRRGFTLIELTVVVLIISLLSSVALTEFQNFVIRSKQGERNISMRNIQNGLIELVTQNDKYPTDLGGGASQLWCDYNPPPPFNGMKKWWNKGQPGWSSLSWEPTGMLYFHYFAYAYASPSLTYMYVIAVSDLDGDGIPAFKETWWQRNGSGEWTEWVDTEWPAGQS